MPVDPIIIKAAPGTPVMLTSKFLLKRRRDRLSAEALGALEDTLADVRVLPARQRLVYEDETVAVSTFLIDGFMARYVDGRNGTRQLVALHIAGDFIDLHSYPLERLDHAVASLTDATIASVPHEVLVRLMARHPELVRMLWFSTMLDAAISREWIFRLGHLPAIGRVAHFFCEMATRLCIVDLNNGDHYPLPLIQADIADACGLTPEHVSRVIRQLREADVVAFKDGVLTIRNWEGMKTIGQFDPGYLYMDGVTD